MTRDGAPFIRGSWVVINAAVFTYRASAYAARRSDHQIPWNLASNQPRFRLGTPTHPTENRHRRPTSPIRSFARCGELPIDRSFERGLQRAGGMYLPRWPPTCRVAGEQRADARMALVPILPSANPSGQLPFVPDPDRCLR